MLFFVLIFFFFVALTFCRLLLVGFRSIHFVRRIDPPSVGVRKHLIEADDECAPWLIEERQKQAKEKGGQAKYVP